MALWIIIVLLTAAILGVLIVPLLLRGAARAAARGEYDLSVFRDQLAEVDRDAERGLLGDSEAKAARIEIKRRMLTAAPADAPGGAKDGEPRRDARALSVGLGIAVPVAAVALYLAMGSPGTPDFPFAGRQIPASQATAQGGQESGNAPDLAKAAVRLAERMKANPDDFQGWVLLARTYLSLDRPADAVPAFRRALQLEAGRPEVKADLAEALALAAGNRIPDESRALFTDILRADPFSIKARFYLGLAKAQRGDVKGALQAWVDLAAISPRNAPWLGQINSQIAKAAQSVGVDPKTVKPSPEALKLAKSLPAPAAEPTPPPVADAPGPTRDDVEAAQSMTTEERGAMIRSMVARLAQRLEENPGDKQGWLRLARAYEVLGEKAKARKAHERAAALK